MHIWTRGEVSSNHTQAFVYSIQCVNIKSWPGNKYSGELKKKNKIEPPHHTKCLSLCPCLPDIHLVPLPLQHLPPLHRLYRAVGPLENLMWFVIRSWFIHVSKSPGYPSCSQVLLRSCSWESRLESQGIALRRGRSLVDPMGSFLSQSLSIKQAISQLHRTWPTLMQPQCVLVGARWQADAMLLCNLGGNNKVLYEFDIR